MSLSVAIIIHPYFLENNIFIDPIIFIEHIVAVLRFNRELDILPKSYRDRNRYNYRYRLASYRYRYRYGPFLLPLSPMLSFSGVVQTSEYNPHPFKFKIYGIGDSFQLFNFKGVVKFQIAYKWQLALLQGLYGILSLLPLSIY